MPEECGLLDQLSRDRRSWHEACMGLNHDLGTYVTAVRLVVLWVPNIGGSVSLTLALSRDYFTPLGMPCPMSLQGLLPCLIISCFLLCGCCLLEACSFLRVLEGWVDLWREEEGTGKSGGRGNCGHDVL